LTIRMPASMRLIAQLRPRPDDDPLECLDAIVARIKAGAGRLTRSVSTVHKAKGLEYNHVMVGNFSAAHFGNDEMSRRIAYVAPVECAVPSRYLCLNGIPAPCLDKPDDHRIRRL